MEKKDLIGRKKEVDLLEQLYSKEEAQLVAIYGRRRVGKTFLVKCFFDEKYDFYFSGSYKTATSVQLALFAQTLHEYSGDPIMDLNNWFQAFTALRDYLSSLKKDRLVVFLDEIPWMDAQKSNFLAAFSQFWNTWGSTSHGLKLVVCGSSTTWMLDKFVGDKGGLYGRSNRCIYLAPFTLKETEQFLLSRNIIWTKQQIALLYMTMGGIPYYLDMLNPSLPLDSNIDQLFFQRKAPLRDEYEFLFRTLFKDAVLYRKIVEILSKKIKGLCQAEIKEELNLKNGGELSTVLNNLQQCDFIRNYSAFGKKSNGQIYQLTDLFTLFYLRFVENSNSQDENFWSNLDLHKKESWMGYAFEMVCLLHITQIKEKLGISGVLTNACSWQTKPTIDSDGTNWPGTQIDLILDRNDDVINLCEMKFSKSEFIISEQYDKTLTQRIETFKHHTRTKKAPTITFITANGLNPNKYAGPYLPRQITLEDLFK